MNGRAPAFTHTHTHTHIYIYSEMQAWTQHLFSPFQYRTHYLWARNLLTFNLLSMADSIRNFAIPVCSGVSPWCMGWEKGRIRHLTICSWKAMANSKIQTTQTRYACLSKQIKYSVWLDSVGHHHLASRVACSPPISPPFGSGTYWSVCT